jgi:hypothetical protein
MMSKSEAGALLLIIAAVPILLLGLAMLGEPDATARHTGLFLIAISAGALVWRYRIRAAAKRAKAMAIAADKLGCTPDEVEALVLLHKLRGK